MAIRIISLLKSNRLTKLYIAAAALAVVTVCVAYEIGPEYHWSFAYLQYIPYYLFCAPVLLAVALSYRCSRRWQITSIAALVLVLTIIMGFAVGWPDDGSERIRVMTFNVKDYITVKDDAGLGTIIEEVNLHDPDILMLQDAVEINAQREEKSPAVLPLFAGKYVYTFGQYAVISRYPLKDCEKGFISYRHEPHTYVHCVVVTGATQIDLYTAHLLTPRAGLNAVRQENRGAISTWQENIADRLTQAQSLASDMQKSIRPIILAGDFNAADRSLVVRTLMHGRLRDAFVSASIGFGYTYGHSLRPGISFLKLDHILVDPSIGVARCYVGSKEVSPHRPVIADLLLKRK